MVGRETHHSLRSAERYTLDFERINFYLKKSLTVDRTSCVTSLHKNLVLKYVGLLQDPQKTKKSRKKKILDEDS